MNNKVQVMISGDDGRNEYSFKTLVPARYVAIWLNVAEASDEEADEVDEYFEELICNKFPNVEFRDFNVSPL